VASVSASVSEVLASAEREAVPDDRYSAGVRRRPDGNPEDGLEDDDDGDDHRHE